MVNQWSVTGPNMIFTDQLTVYTKTTNSGDDVVVVQLKTLNQHRFKAHSRIYEAASECDVMTV